MKVLLILLLFVGSEALAQIPASRSLPSAIPPKTLGRNHRILVPGKGPETFSLDENDNTLTYVSFYNLTTDMRLLHLGKPAKDAEVAFQFSFKTLLFNLNLATHMALYLGYKQRSFWQFYVKKAAYFRSTDYEPSVYLTTYQNDRFGVDLGIDHQANGRGDVVAVDGHREGERTWTRFYVRLNLWKGGSSRFHAFVKAWVPIHTASMKKYNPDIAKYLGYSEVGGSFSYGSHGDKAACSLRNIEGVFRPKKRFYVACYATAPLYGMAHMFGKVAFGYGDSLIAYNKEQAVTSVGMAFLPPSS